MALPVSDHFTSLARCCPYIQAWRDDRCRVVHGAIDRSTPIVFARLRGVVEEYNRFRSSANEEKARLQAVEISGVLKSISSELRCL